MKKLIVSIPKDDNNQPKHPVIKVSEKKEGFGQVLLKVTEHKAVATKSGGFVFATVSRSAYFSGQLPALQSFALAEGVDFNAITGANLTIARKESRTPFYEGQTPKINPETNETILVDGAPVYFNDYVAPAGTQDELIVASSEVVAPVAHTEAGAMN